MIAFLLATVLVACVGPVEGPIDEVVSATDTDTDIDTDPNTDTDTDSDTAFLPSTGNPWECEVYRENEETLSFSGETARDDQTTEYGWLIAGSIPVVITDDSGNVRAPDYVSSFDAAWSGRFLSNSEMELSEGNWNDMWGKFTSQCWMEE